ncbi:MAG: hypothetical protein ACFCU8_05070 [Thermosynechococcaceae cyanobacterium]
MISSSQSVRVANAFSQLRTNLYQSIQDWIRREIVDDDPYEELMLEESQAFLPLTVQSTTNTDLV